MSSTSGHVELGVADESDVVSVSVLPPEPGRLLHAKHGGALAKVRVIIVYWQ